MLTFKAYLHTQFFVIGEEPEFSEVGTIENIWFDDIEVDLIRPIDGRERCGLTAYSGSDPVRGHFAAFEFGTNADGVHFRNVRVRLHPDKWSLSHFMTVGPKSATFRRAGDGVTDDIAAVQRVIDLLRCGGFARNASPPPFGGVAEAGAVW